MKAKSLLISGPNNEPLVQLTLTATTDEYLTILARLRGTAIHEQLVRSVLAAAEVKQSELLRKEQGNYG